MAALVCSDAVRADEPLTWDREAYVRWGDIGRARTAAELRTAQVSLLQTLRGLDGAPSLARQREQVWRDLLRSASGPVLGGNPFRPDHAAEALRTVLSEYAMTRRADDPLRAQVLATYPRRNFTEDDARRAVQRAMQDEAQRAARLPENDPRRIFFELLAASALANDNDNSLGAHVDPALVAQRLAEVGRDPRVREMSERVAQQARRNVALDFSYRQTLAELQSDGFVEQMRLAGPQVASEMLRRAIAPILAVDPAAAQSVIDGIIGRMAVDELANLPRADQVGAFDRALLGMARDAGLTEADLAALGVNGTRNGAGALHNLAEALAGDPVGRLERVQAAMQRYASQPGVTRSLNVVMQRIDRAGGLQLLSASAAAYALTTNPPQDGQQWLAAGGTSMTAVADASQGMIRLGALVRGASVTEGSLAARALLRPNLLAGVGNLVGAAADTWDAVNLFSRGAYGQGACAVGSAASGLVAAAGCVGLVSGPVALIAAAAVLGFGLMKDWLHVREQRQWLERLRVYTPNARERRPAPGNGYAHLDRGPAVWVGPGPEPVRPAACDERRAPPALQLGR